MVKWLMLKPTLNRLLKNAHLTPNTQSLVLLMFVQKVQRFANNCDMHLPRIPNPSTFYDL